MGGTELNPDFRGRADSLSSSSESQFSESGSLKGRNVRNWTGTFDNWSLKNKALATLGSMGTVWICRAITKSWYAKSTTVNLKAQNLENPTSSLWEREQEYFQEKNQAFELSETLPSSDPAYAAEVRFQHAYMNLTDKQKSKYVSLHEFLENPSDETNRSKAKEEWLGGTGPGHEIFSDFLEKKIEPASAFTAAISGSNPETEADFDACKRVHRLHMKSKKAGGRQ